MDMAMQQQRDIPLVVIADADLDFPPTSPHGLIRLTGTITANRNLGIGLMGAREGEQIVIKREDVSAFTWTIKSGSAAGGTVLATFPSRQSGFVVLKCNGGVWERMGGLNVEEDDLELHGTFTWDPGNLIDAAGETKADIACAGAAFGDFVEISAPYSLQGLTLNAYVQAADLLGARLQNETGGAVDLVSGTWRYRVRKGR